MAKLLKLRGGTTSQHGSFTGADREVTVDTDKETGNLIAYPLDDRIPAIIELEDDLKNIKNNINNDFIYEVNVTKYPIAQFNAKGKIIRQ